MTIQEIMSAPVKTCSPETSIAQAARLMRDAGYGVVPVTDSDGRIMGIITDRDICLAIANSNRSPRAIAVREVMTTRITFVRPADDPRIALSTMKHARVRRAPVVDASQRIVGLVSVDDFAVRGIEEGAIDAADLVDALHALSERRLARREPAAA